MIPIILILLLTASLSAQRCTFERPRNCEEVQFSGLNTSGVYRIFPDSLSVEGREVFCDLATGGGGWTVFQKRSETTENDMEFFKSWDEYALGFGSLSESFWLGLDLIADLTKGEDMRLRVELTDWEEEFRFAEYSKFKVGDASTLYELSVSGYSGNANDSLANQNNMKFTTKDRDNDLREGQNCALAYEGAWWYRNCHSSNLNGRHLRGEHASYANGINWYRWHGNHYSLMRTEMKMRSQNFQCLSEAYNYFC